MNASARLTEIFGVVIRTRLCAPLAGLPACLSRPAPGSLPPLRGPPEGVQTPPPLRVGPKPRAGSHRNLRLSKRYAPFSKRHSLVERRVRPRTTTPHRAEQAPLAECSIFPYTALPIQVWHADSALLSVLPLEPTRRTWKGTVDATAAVRRCGLRATARGTPSSADCLSFGCMKEFLMLIDVSRRDPGPSIVSCTEPSQGRRLIVGRRRGDRPRATPHSSEKVLCPLVRLSAGTLHRR